MLLAFLLFLRGQVLAADGRVLRSGLGSLETAVMYPVIVLAYTLLYDRKEMRRTAALFVISAAYTALHFWAAPAAKSGPYAIRIDARIFGTFGAYVKLATGPAVTHALPLATGRHGSRLPALPWLAAGVVARDVSPPGRAGLFGLAWFVALLVPMLPLPEHVEDYVLTGPAIGLAMILAAALARRPLESFRWLRCILRSACPPLGMSRPGKWNKAPWPKS